MNWFIRFQVIYKRKPKREILEVIAVVYGMTTPSNSPRGYLQIRRILKNATLQLQRIHGVTTDTISPEDSDVKSIDQQLPSQFDQFEEIVRPAPKIS